MSGLTNKLAGQIGEYLVCAELGRRNLIATPFSGNVPTFDILAADEQCRTVPIQVKASRSDNWNADARHWMNIEFNAQTGVQHFKGLATITNPELIYVCVAIAKIGERDRFFILTKADIQQVCSQRYIHFMEPKEWKRPRNPKTYDNRYHIDDIARFEDNWDLIAQRLQASTPDKALTNVEDSTSLNSNQDLVSNVSTLQIDALLAFLPVFEQENFSFGDWVTKAGQMPYFSTAEVVRRFTKTLYDQNILFSFDWGAWAAQEGDQYIKNPDALAKADLLTLRKLLTLHIRQDRFCEGHLAAMLEQGHITAILRRLQQLRALIIVKVDEETQGNE